MSFILVHKSDFWLETSSPSRFHKKKINSSKSKPNPLSENVVQFYILISSHQCPSDRSTPRCGTTRTRTHPFHTPCTGELTGIPMEMDSSPNVVYDKYGDLTELTTCFTICHERPNRETSVALSGHIMEIPAESSPFDAIKVEHILISLTQVNREFCWHGATCLLKGAHSSFI